MGCDCSYTNNYHRLMSYYVNQTTTHGVRRISASKNPGRRAFWICVFLSSLSICLYHCSYLIMNYNTSPKVTITEEKDAYSVEFPAVTICNLNVIKKTFAEQYFELASTLKQPSKRNASRKLCFRSEQELASTSAIDLSDTWLNLGVTKDNLSRYGHQAVDLIIQCTYNSYDCFSDKFPFNTTVVPFTSPSFGLCHTISVINKKTKTPVEVKKGGTSNGIRLTLNIEREYYWDLISPEFGVRILVHPHGTLPTLQKGGIIVNPGRSVHIGIKRRVSKLLPGRDESCTETFQDSKLMTKLEELGLDFDVSKVKYTYEHCNTLCENAMMFDTCGCLDEQPRISGKSNWRFCNPCNKTESDCRSKVLRNFSEAGNLCDDLCKPACSSIRYEIILSKSSWPNIDHQQFVINRSKEQWRRIPAAIGLLNLPFDEINDTDFVNETFFSENLLRAHLFIEDMIYTSIEERFSYTLPKLLADLGGCLGLYLGVSVISIIELVELFGNVSLVCLCGSKNHSSKTQSSNFFHNRSKSRRRRRKRTGNNTVGSFSPTYNYSKKDNQRSNEADVWRPFFPALEPYYQNRGFTRRNDTTTTTRRF